MSSAPSCLVEEPLNLSSSERIEQWINRVDVYGLVNQNPSQQDISSFGKRASADLPRHYADEVRRQTWTGSKLALPFALTTYIFDPSCFPLNFAFAVSIVLHSYLLSSFELP